MTVPRTLKDPVLFLGLAALYFLAGKLGLQLAIAHPRATAVWPPTGIALAAFLLYGRRVWPAIFAGAFLVNLTTAGTVATTFGIAAGNTLEGVVGAALVGGVGGGRAGGGVGRRPAGVQAGPNGRVVRAPRRRGRHRHQPQRGSREPCAGRVRALAGVRIHLAHLVAGGYGGRG